MPPHPWWVKLSDFGISKRVADNLAVPSTVKGTVGYMAPELFGFIKSAGRSELSMGQAADMWALGETAFQMLTKQSTFEDISLLSVYVHSPDNFPSGVLRACHISEVGIQFIRNIMSPKPEDRQTAAQAVLQPWMEPHNSYITARSSNELVM